MTAQKSNNYFFANFKTRLRLNKKLIIMALVFNILAVPLYILSHIVEEFKGGYMQLQTVISTVCLLASVFMGLLITINTFNYLYKKSNVDLIYSLPLTSKQRFFSDFLAGFVSYMGPYLVGFIVSIPLTLLYEEVSDDRMLIDLFNAYSMKPIEVIAKCMGILAVSMILFYCLNTIISCVCGSLFETIAYSIGINILIPVFILLCHSFTSNLFGMSGELDPFIKFVQIFSPVGGILAIAQLFEYDLRLEVGLSINLWLLFSLILIAALIIGSFFLYKKRKAEDVSKPFVYKGFYYVILVAITFCFVALSVEIYKGADVFVSTIISAAIIFLTLEVITNRGFKKIWLSVIKYAVTMTVIGSLFLLVNVTDGFGTVYKVPDIKDVSSVVLSTPRNKSLKIEDKEIIKSVIDVHEKVLEDYRRNDKNLSRPIESKYIDYNNSNQDKVLSNEKITIQYNLKGFKSFTRKYNTANILYKEIANIELNDKYIDKVEEKLRSFVSDKKFRCELSIYRSNDYKSFNSYVTDNKKINKFIDYYISDLRTLDYEKYSNRRFFWIKDEDSENVDEEDIFIANIHCSKSWELELNENYVKTNKYLKLLSEEKESGTYEDEFVNEKIYD